MPYTPIKDIAGANSAIADLYGRADAAMKAVADLALEWNAITGKPSIFTSNWASVADKPSTFTPTAHNQDWSTITSKPSTFTPATHNQDWSTITGKPTVVTATLENGYWGINTPSSGTWLRVGNSSGLIPYQASGAGGLGSPTWPWATAYVKDIYENGALLSSKYAAASHGHAISGVTGLQNALDAKAALGGTLLYSGSWSTGTIDLSDLTKYRVYLVVFSGMATALLATRPAGFAQIRGVGGQSTTDPYYYTYHFSANVSGTTLTYVAAGWVRHDPGATSGHGSSANNLAVANIYGIA